MKGVIFTEFMEMVEEKWGLKMVDDIIIDSKDPEDGAYSSTMYYKHENLVAMVLKLHEKTQIPLKDLLICYGTYLFPKLAESHMFLLKDIECTITLLERLEPIIHLNVKKLYPQSHPPTFRAERVDQNTLNLYYQSHRKMEDVAEGLILGCAKFYNEDIKVEREDESGNEVKFIVRKTG